MTTITKERLLTIKQWRETYGPGSNVVLPAEEAEELARIALASLAAESVSVNDDMAYAFHHALSDSSLGADEVEEIKTGLRAAFANVTIQPEPVVPDEIALAIENLKQKLVECNRYNYCADAVKGVEDACRAAILHGSEPVSQAYKLPPMSSNEVNDAAWKLHNMLTEHGPLNGCQFNNLKESFYEALKVAMRNYPVIPDSWISCSERMPAQDDWILIYSKHGEYMAGQVQGEYVELSDGTLSWLGNALFWMQLPEPPQEVNQ
ncbi:DUF551 domain-containing protein [Escherichia coli]|nr:DUF551 domain-containing protein [Escherichia coli]